MRWLLILAFVGFALIPVAADAQRATDPPPISHERVSVVVSADWNDDGLEDKAVLYVIHDGVDLIIYFSAGPSQPLKVHTWVKGITQPGFLEEQPALALSSGKDLELTVSQFGFGRYQFESTLTIAFREGVFRAAGYTYMVNDRLEERASRCGVDLLTGEGIKNGKAFRTDLRAVPITEWGETIPPPSDWKDPKIPLECLKIFD